MIYKIHLISLTWYLRPTIIIVASAKSYNVSDLGDNPQSRSDLDSKQNPSSVLGEDSSSVLASSKSSTVKELGPDGLPWDDTVDYDIVSDEEPSSNGTSNEKPFSIENPNEDPSPNITINEEPSSNVNENEEPSSNRTPASESNPPVGWTYRPSVTYPNSTTPPIRTPEPFIPKLPPTPLGFVMPSKDPRAPPPLHAKSPWREPM
ncbi:hypothetical protein GEMRC1_010879 [Eukaryota sp. GEM-RC1]